MKQFTMSQDIARFENLLNNEKQLLIAKEQEKVLLVNKNETKQREIQTSNERALTMPNSEPLLLALLHQSINVQDAFIREKTELEREITEMKTRIASKEQQLIRMKNQQLQKPNTWSSTFK
jgi:hypothetical protein